ncbi:transcriptional regulator TyrR [Thaumasiovibrio subtropicus]|uniref:transcriptional regulator TyrR n=1 Tax=Thaumasiovibrio subtropicus TaxID=1891207 RepID=UPI000B360372|nr:transcriptional regulator TyrR [Thaumasiovibrio subtropicus]
MRLEVQCEDRLGLTRELLDILAEKEIDLRGIEIDTSGIIFLNCPEIEFEQFSKLMSQIRLIDGVLDVRKIQFMPGEREHRELKSLLGSLPDPVFSVDLSGKVALANQAASLLYSTPSEEMKGETIDQYLSQFNFAKWLEQHKRDYEPSEQETAPMHTEMVVIGGLDYVMEVMPVYVSDESKAQVLASAVVLLKAMSGIQRPIWRQSYDNTGFEHLIGHSSRFKQLVNQAKKLALLDAPLLIQGETGTGKEVLARACHHRSQRSQRPFLLLNSISMPDNAAETELFGYLEPDGSTKKGIFEQADGGTVFLYEVGEMSAHLQIKLLRFLQDGTFRRVGEEKEVKVDVRVICSTQRKLSELVAEGKFREDLYYRLNVLSLTVPPLRERNADILPLTELFLKQFAAELQQVKPELTLRAEEQLVQYPWPGNIRQLRNILLRSLSQVEGRELDADDLQLPEVESNTLLSEATLDGTLDEIMGRYEASILSNLYKSFPSTRKLAKRLGVSHTAVANKLREYAINKS